MIIDLIWVASGNPSPAWSFGLVHEPGCDLQSIINAVQRSVQKGETDGLLFWDGSIAPVPGLRLLEDLLESPDDLWHAGLRMGMYERPGLLDFVSPTWMFQRDPGVNQNATGWRLSLRACLVRADVIRQVGFLNPGYETLEAAGLEWGHRCIQRGVLCRYQPDLVPEGKAEDAPRFPPKDEARFVRYRCGQRWVAWALGRALFSGYYSISQVMDAFFGLKDEQGESVLPVNNREIPPISLPETLPKTSVLIPTLERYPYLYTLLGQLRLQRIKADEIIVVDQTPVQDRQEHFYAAFSDLPLKVIFQDQPGQCSSRNAGLQIATGDFVLFLDDDDEIDADLIEQHLLTIHHFKAQASCGVALETGTGPLPEAFTYLKASDVFPTNNSMVSRTALAVSGWFDLAYNRGARADADLGMRLYLSGARMILNPEIAVLHHHAPRGGLRVHKARKITYSSSRRNLLHRHIPSPTEIYLAKRYFSGRQLNEMKWISIFSTFSLHGSLPSRVLKSIVSLLLLPDSMIRLFRSERAANKLLIIHPTIPGLSSDKE